MPSRSALTAALSNKPGDTLPTPEEIIKSEKHDNFSFPCLGGRESQGKGVEEDLERLDISEARSLAGSAAYIVKLPDGSLAVCPPPFLQPPVLLSHMTQISIVNSRANVPLLYCPCQSPSA